mgnify:CR=1 FL=1
MTLRISSKVIPILSLCAAILLMLNGIGLSAQDGVGIDISGRVVDENGEALIGAGVVASDGKNMTITDMQGNFKITVTGANPSLKFSFIGYIDEVVKVTNKTTINVRMTPDVNTLEDVVVIGYGTVKKDDLTGAITGNPHLTVVSFYNVGDALIVWSVVFQNGFFAERIGCRIVHLNTIVRTNIDMPFAIFKDASDVIVR